MILLGAPAHAGAARQASSAPAPARTPAPPAATATPVQASGATKRTTTPPSFESIAAKAETARSAGRLDEAAGLYRKGLALRPGWTEGRLALAVILGDQQQYREAREHLSKLTGAGEGGAEAWALLGLACSRLKDYEPALAALDRARRLGLSVPELRSAAVFETALLLNRATNHEGAFDVLRSFASEGNDNPTVIVAFGLAVLRRPQMPDEVPAEKREMVLLAGRGGFHMARPRRTALGRLALEELVSRYPAEPNVHYALGNYLAPDDPPAAAEEFRRELRRDPDHAEALIQLAHLETRRGDPAAALPLAEKAVTLVPEVPAGWLVLGRTLLDLDRAEDAIVRLEKAAALASSNPDVQFALARAYQRAGRPDAAARAREEFQRLEKQAHDGGSR